MSSWTLNTGWLRCTTSGREELVAISIEHQHGIATGTIPCPGCKAMCRPEFQPASIRADIGLLAWRRVGVDTTGRELREWVAGFALA